MPNHSPTGLTLRELSGPQELRACFELQKETWGESFAELVPQSILYVSQKIGGVLAGALDRDEHLAAFVFGMTGLADGEPLHWSEMLAVRLAYRNRGLGRALKEFQRDRLLELGVGAMCWTYDPLVSRNAHLNLNRLGARIQEYALDLYSSDSGSILHRGIGTDRFIVRWDFHRSPPDDTARQLLRNDFENAPIFPEVELPDLGAGKGPPRFRVEVPADISAVQSASLEKASAWRNTSREAFRRSFECGYEVRGFYRDPDSGRSFYAVQKDPVP